MYLKNTETTYDLSDEKSHSTKSGLQTQNKKQLNEEMKTKQHKTGAEKTYFFAT